MITIAADNDSMKVISAQYENNNFKKSIEFNILTISKNNDENNVGTILEKYRSDNNTQSYYTSKKSILENFIKNSKMPFSEFFPDSIICIFPLDENRHLLLTKFKQNISSKYSNETYIDYSENFTKKDKTKSIKKDNLTAEDFELNISNSKPFKKLLIIDDVIDEGKTLEILLDKLLKKKMIDNETVIKMACIYNRPKSNKPPISYLDAFRSKTNLQN
jgi:predicted amidophosphoribosyltransferase